MDTFVRALNALLMIALPLALGVFLARRAGTSWGLFGAGAVTFVASQALHIPFNAFILNAGIKSLGWAGASGGWALVGVSVVLGLSAGLFEESARYATYRLWVKGARRWVDGLMLGAGHGGIEAILLGGLTTWALVQAYALRGADLSAVLPADQVAAATAQLAAYWGAPWHAALLGAVERLFALCMHLSLSVLVLQVFVRPKWFWFPLAVAWHATIDAVAVYSAATIGPYATEALVGVGALLSLVVVWALRSRSLEEVKPQIPPPPAPEMLARHDKEDVSADQVQDSRFSG
jgi:uncharacterized membrane protein YhfC